MSSELENRLHEFDGITVSTLREARAACHAISGYLEELIRLCVDPRPHVSNGATWILKAEADDGTKFDPALTGHLLEALDDISPWQAKLHILQSLEAFEISAEQARGVFDWASSLADHPRPFVRAWSLHVRVTLALRFGEFRHESEMALSAAENDSAASVRARARNLKY